MKKTLSHISEIKVRFNEVDSMDIVWHGHYVQYFEDGREHFGQHYGITYMEVHRNGFTIPVVDMQLKYRTPIRYEDEVMLETTYHFEDAAKIHFSYKLYNKSTLKVYATGDTVQVFMDKKENLQLINPGFYANWKEKYKDK